MTMKNHTEYLVDDLNLENRPGIADKTKFSKFMCDTVDFKNYKRLLDVGCGSGVVGIYALVNQISFVYFNDIQRSAMELSKINISKNSILEDKYQFIEGSFNSIDLSKYLVDIIIFNPPQLPTGLVNIESFSEESEKKFRDGGDNGRKIISDFFLWLSKQPIDGISIYLCLSSVLKIDPLLKEIKQKYGLSATKEKSKTVVLREIFYPSIKKMSQQELSDREVKLIDDKYYKNIYVVKFKK